MIVEVGYINSFISLQVSSWILLKLHDMFSFERFQLTGRINNFRHSRTLINNIITLEKMQFVLTYKSTFYHNTLGFLMKVAYIGYCKPCVKSFYVFCIIASISDVRVFASLFTWYVCHDRENPTESEFKIISWLSWHKEEIAYFSSDTEIDYWYYL